MMRHALLPLALCLALPVFASGDDHGHDHDEHSDHKAAVDGVTILHAWTRAGRAGTRDIYMEIANEGDTAVTLIGGETHEGLAATIVATEFTSAGTKFTPLDAFPIDPGAEIDLTPDGLFLRVDGFPLAVTKGESFEFHVELDPVGEIEVVVDVEAADAKQHSHAGHNH